MEVVGIEKMELTRYKRNFYILFRLTTSFPCRQIKEELIGEIDKFGWRGGVG